MPRRRGTIYTLGFAAIVCVVCAVMVSFSAVTLKPLQTENRRIDKQKNILLAAGLVKPGESPTNDEIAALFAERVQPVLVERKSGEVLGGVDAAHYDQRAAIGDPELSVPAPPNRAKVPRLPGKLLVYRLMRGVEVEMLIIPVQGKGLWSTLYGFLALDGRDPALIEGIAFYEHGETPGLGGEVDNPKWRALWKGRRALDKELNPVFALKKGAVGPPADDPYHVDALTGATKTSNGVTALTQFWLGENGYGPYLARYVGRRGE